MSVWTEAELLRDCRKGERRAWNELFDRHYATAARFIRQVSPDLTREDAEEICQETFLAVIRSIFAFHGQCQFQTWLFRIAANKAHDFVERQRAAKRGGGQAPISLQAENIDGLTLDPPSTTPAPDSLLINAENASLIGQALEQLGGSCREVIDLRYFADLSYGEIAETLEVSPKTVSSRLSKCLDRLEGIATRLFSRERNKPLSV